MDILTKMKEQYKAAVAGMQEIADIEANEALTEDQQKKFDEYKAEADDLKAKIERREETLKAQANAEAMKAIPVVDRKVVDAVTDVAPDAEKKIVIPASAKRWGGSLKSFKGEDADIRAYKAGRWVLACLGHNSSRKWCAEHGLPVQYLGGNDDLQIASATPHNEYNNIYGGYLVYDELNRDIVDLTSEYGVIRRLFNVRTMGSETLSRPRRTGGLTAYFVGEGSSGTHSKKTWDRIMLVAKKIMVTTTMSSELNEDSIISMADDLVMEIGRANAYLEDYCGILGDGTQDYGGITGISTKLSSLNGVDDGGGMILGAGDTMAEITMANLHSVVARIPDYAEANAQWLVHRSFYHNTMVRLMAALGGTTPAMVVANMEKPSFLGYPVNFSNIMPSTDSTSQIIALFGDFRQAADFGDRRAQTVKFITEGNIDSVSMAETDQIGVIATERIDINVHDVGTASAAGPVVCLITASS